MDIDDTPSSEGPLRDKIEVWAQKHAAEFPAEVLELFAKKSEEVIGSNILDTSPKVGQIVADFQLQTHEGTTVILSEQAKIGPVILNFYRGAWCHFCNLEFQTLLATMPRFQKHGASVLAVSPQINESNLVPGDIEGVFINLIDRGNQLARNFNLVYPLGDEIRKVYERFGIFLNKLNGDESYEVPVPASYIIDQNLMIRYAFTSADLTERAEPDVLLKVLSNL